MSPRYPLDGVRVLDLSRVLAGPYVGRMLCDLGAEVVKVEPPEGDVTRVWGRKVAGLSGYFTQQNVGKQGISVDLRRDGAPELLRSLAARADIVLENFRPGVMAQYGLDYPALAARNARLIMLSISGYGQVGPESGRPAYASVIHAESGIVHRQAEMDQGKAGPQDLRVSLADMNAALHGLAAVLAALYQRDRTGQGQHIDIAMIDTMLATDDHAHLAIDGASDIRAFVNDVWDAGFCKIVLAGDLRWIFRQLSERCGVVDETPPDAPLAVKIDNRKRAVQKFLLSFTDRQALFAALERAELAWGEVLPSARAIESPTVRARKSLVEVDDRAGGKRRVVQSPYRFSAAHSGVRGAAPHRGEHNRAVLKAWLDLGDAEIDLLHAQGVLLQELPP
jgi:CoA:oxalate CoA-transferase